MLIFEHRFISPKNKCATRNLKFIRFRLEYIQHTLIYPAWCLTSQENLSIYTIIYILCMYACMHVCMYVRTYVCMYVRTYVCMRKIHIDPHQTDQEYSTNLHRTVYQYSWWLTSPSRLFYGRSFTSRFTHHQPVIIQTEPCPPGPNQLGWASPMCHRSRNTSAGSLRSK